jgi:hypothetical protein
MSQLKWSRVWTAAALAAPLLLVPAIALARAGGGQNYGGSGGGGGFGDDGGDGLWSLLPLLFLGHGTGFGGLVAFLVVLYVFKQLRRGASGGFGGGLGGGLGAILDGGAPPAPGMPVGQVLDVPVHHFNQDAAADGIAAIKAKDQNFDERAFLDRAQTSFFKVQQAWAARNQDLARECMSDALYERHKMQTDQLIANHQIDVLENIVIGNAHIMSASAGAAFDSITVAFTASMTDYTVDEGTRKVVDGNQFRQTFTEFWTFIRRGDQKSTAGQTTLSPTCSSCGAPLKLTQGRCDYCGAFARTSSTDWVVDTIEQP